MNRHKVTGSVLAVVVMMLVCTGANAAWFTSSYEADVLPTAADPAWNALYSANNFANVVSAPEGSYLNLNSLEPNNARPQYSMTSGAGSAWDLTNSTEFTIQIRMQIIDHTGYNDAFQILAGDATRRLSFAVRENAAWLGLATNAIPVDATEWNVYHLTGVKNGGIWAFSLYVNDDSEVKTHGGLSSTAQQFFWGDISANLGAVGGNVNIDYIRWDPTTAHAIPEPASMLMVLGGGLLAALRRRRN